MNTAYIRLLRPLQWLKSIFVLAGMLYSKNFIVYLDVVKAVISFSLISSAVYIYNDIHDVEEDSLHPIKKHRPLVTEEIPLNIAAFLCVALIIIAYSFAYLTSWALIYILTAYVLVNVFYNFIGKQIPWIDVCCIAFGFFLRVVAGTVGIGIPMSLWLAFSATLLSLYLALSKRFLEKRIISSNSRKVLFYYQLTHLKRSINLACGGCIVTYAYYIIAVHRQSLPFILSTIPVTLMLLKFNRAITKTSNTKDDPLVIMLEDRFIVFMLVCFTSLMCLALVYG